MSQQLQQPNFFHKSSPHQKPSQHTLGLGFLQTMASKLLRSLILRSAILTSPNPSPFLRHLSSASPRRPLSIAARARRLQTRRLLTYALTVTSISAFTVIILATFQDHLLFYITPSDALSKFLSNPSKSRFRLGGLVLEGSVLYHPSEMEFVVTDLVTDVLVRYEGALPDLFREGHSVVVEGFLREKEEGEWGSEGRSVTEKARGLGCYFRATEVLAKHDEKYMPKEVAAAIEKNRRRLEEEGSG